MIKARLPWCGFLSPSGSGLRARGVGVVQDRSAAVRLFSVRRAGVAGFPVAEYSKRQLVALASWVMSDTLLRPDDELLRELRWELGFLRGGSRVDAAILDAIAVVRSRRGR